MRIPMKAGILRVIQPFSGAERMSDFYRDFDAEEWSYVWVKRCGIDILCMRHDNSDDNSDSFEFVEFSAPVQIEFIAQH